MSASWNQLLGSVLQSHAYKKAMYVAAGSCCEILSVEQIIPTQLANTDCDVPHQFIIEAALVGNLGKKVFLQSRFVLPSESPKASMQDYRTAWDSSFGAYCVIQRSTVSTQPTPMATVELTGSSLSSKSQKYTAEEARAVPRPTRFNWADDVEDEIEPLSVKPTRIRVAPSFITTSTSSETSSAYGTNSQPSTPITPFSRHASPEFPSLEITELQHSRLTLSLDLATKTSKVDKPRGSQKFDWLNLIQHDHKCGQSQEKFGTPTTEDFWEACKSLFSVSLEKSRGSNRFVALDLAIQEKPKDLSNLEEANQRHTPASEGVNVKEDPVQCVAQLLKDTAEDENLVPDTETAGPNSDTDGKADTKAKQAVKAKDKPQLSHEPSAFDRMDLDTIFGGPADDLCEGYEDENRAGRAGIDLAPHKGTVDARKNGLSSELSTVSVGASGNLDSQRNPGSVSLNPSLFVVVDPKGKGKSSIIDWDNLLAVTQRAKLEGLYKHKPLEAADRSKDWLWEPSNVDNRRHYDPRILSTAAGSDITRVNRAVIPAVDQEEPHHLNYLQQPVFHKTDTPPEVSLWAVCSAHALHYQPVSRQGVVASQAGKLIDPFWYSGPPELLLHQGTRLREEVTGYVEKLYHPKGTWIYDRYSLDETVPRVIKGNAYTDISNAPDCLSFPQPVHRMAYAREVPRPTTGKIHLYPEPVDIEDATVNDDGCVHVNGPDRDGNWVLPPPSRLSIVQACSQEISDLPLLSLKLKRTRNSTVGRVLSSVDHLTELPILPAQSEGAIATENEVFYSEPAIPDSPELAQAVIVGLFAVEPTAITDLPNLAEAEEGEQTSIEPALDRRASVRDLEEGKKISDEPAVTNSPELAEAEEGEQSSVEESDSSDASRATTTQTLKDFFGSPGFILTQKHVQAIMDGKEDEAAAIQTQRNEFRASTTALTINNTHKVSDDQEQIDYTNTWVKRNVRSLSNQDYLSRWSDSAAVAAHDDANSPEEEDLTKDDDERCSSSPANSNAASPTRSLRNGDGAMPEDLELESMDDESSKVIDKLRELGDLPPPLYQGQRRCDVDVNVGEACEAGKEKSAAKSTIESSPNQDLYAEILDLIQENEVLLACDGVDIDLANLKDAKTLKPPTILTGNDMFASRGYTRPMTVEEEEELLDHGHIAAMVQQEQADAQAEILLSAYLGYLKFYHRKSWEATSDNLSSLEVTSAVDQIRSEQKESDIGQVSVASISSPLPNPKPAAAAVHDVETSLHKSYKYTTSAPTTLPKEKGEFSEVDTDSASDLSSSPSGDSPSEQRNCAKVNLSDYEEYSEHMEDDLAWNEQSELIDEQAEQVGQDVHESNDNEESKVDSISVSSEDIANMSTHNLDGLLSDLSDLLAKRPASENAGQDSSPDLGAVDSAAGEEEDELVQDTLEVGQLAVDKELLAEEARKLAGREKEVVEREAKLAEAEKLLAQKEKDLAEEMKAWVEENTQLAREKELADQIVEEDKAEEEAVDHAFDTVSCPSDIPYARPSFKEHFYGSFAIAVGGKASKLAMGLSGVLRSSANLLHRG